MFRFMFNVLLYLLEVVVDLGPVQVALLVTDEVVIDFLENERRVHARVARRLQRFCVRESFQRLPGERSNLTEKYNYMTQ